VTQPAPAPLALPGGWRLAVHASLPSTSDLCRALAQHGEPEGLAVLAHQQTGGRGSNGRAWVSPPGNLYLSALLRPPGRAREAGQWSLLAGVALAEAVAALLPTEAPLALKWPNDLLLGEAKLAGILIDSSAAEGRLDWLVIGIGVNLASAPHLADRLTTCLAEHVAVPTPETMAAAVLARLAHWRTVHATHGFAPIRAAWSPWAARLPHFTGLSESGALLPLAVGV
jgi:BirA family biotin operon repressor/biotin-[acetyl-CoA-carboxylase] ligase